MTLDLLDMQNPLLFGADCDEGLVAVELAEHRDGSDEAVLFFFY